MADDVGRKEKAEFIVHGSAVAAAGAAASAWFPGSDAAVLMPIQVAMVAGVAKEYDVAVSASAIKGVVYASLAQMFGKAGAGILVRYVPVAGNVVRASVAFGVTEALGRMVINQLESGEGLP